MIAKTVTPQTPVNGTCATCRYSIVQQLPPPNIGKVRVCRRFPPTVVSTPAQNGINLMSPFPIVADENWCFEYAPEVAANS